MLFSWGGSVLNLSNILALAALAWGFYNYYKVKRAARIVFVREQTVALFDEITRQIPELTISFDGNPISNNLVLLRAAIANIGERDISPSMVEEPIIIALPDGSKWKKANVISKSEGVRESLHIDENRLQIESGLFRIKEEGVRYFV